MGLLYIKAPSKTLRFFYDYKKGDFEGLRTESLFVIDAWIDVVVVYGGYIAEIPEKVERYVSYATL